VRIEAKLENLTGSINELAQALVQFKQ
jgi:hypothetical protein